MGVVRQRRWTHLTGDRRRNSPGSSEDEPPTSSLNTWAMSGLASSQPSRSLPAQDHGPPEAVRLGERPVGHQPAPAQPDHAQAIRVDALQLFEKGNEVQNVVDVGASEFVAPLSSGRPAILGSRHHVPPKGRGQQLGEDLYRAPGPEVAVPAPVDDNARVLAGRPGFEEIGLDLQAVAAVGDGPGSNLPGPVQPVQEEPAYLGQGLEELLDDLPELRGETELPLDHQPGLVAHHVAHHGLRSGFGVSARDRSARAARTSGSRGPKRSRWLSQQARWSRASGARVKRWSVSYQAIILGSLAAW